MKKLSQHPSPKKAKQRLLQAIQKNEPAEWLLYQTLKDATVTIGPVTIQIWANFNDNLHEYAGVWLLLTSPEGRKWLKEHLDNVLDYIEHLIGSA